MWAVRRFLNCLVVLFTCNIAFLWNLPDIQGFTKTAATILLLIFFVWVNIAPQFKKHVLYKSRGLGGGCELLSTSALCAVLQVCLYLLLGQSIVPTFSLLSLIISTIVFLVLLSVPVLNGTIRLLITSKQLTLTHRILFIIFWWVPVANVVIVSVIYFIARKEYRFAVLRFARNQARASELVCKTKYPMLMIHGIFFRDWKLLGYWGRIPAELEQNGATLYYGHQQSSSSVPVAAQEIKDQILHIVESTGCEKVNIVAHSKGGLDARYAISSLGMDQCVASLTTICAPHHGCRFAKKALDNLPENLVAMVSKNYNKIFTALGDKQPDFFSGVSELSDEKCTQLNEQLPDCTDVLYQSVGAKMKSRRSAMFPLNLGFSIIDPIDGENDGLVAVNSMPWGSDFTMLEPKGRHGISHADVIDLTQKDVVGFDVCEFYVGMLQRLKERGM